MEGITSGRLIRQSACSTQPSVSPARTRHHSPDSSRMVNPAPASNTAAAEADASGSSRRYSETAAYPLAPFTGSSSSPLYRAGSGAGSEEGSEEAGSDSSEDSGPELSPES